MEPVRTERRLAAILAADVVGYSRLVEKDEAGTLTALRKLRTETIDPLIARHKGRVVKRTGDGAIVEFGSVVDAVSCAVAVQKETAAAQTGVAADRRIVFRIGVNLGDVVVEGDDLMGDGVNVAARIEQLCDPGGVPLSGTAYDQLRGKLGLPLDFSGEQKVKNIAEPVRTYRVRLAGGSIPWRLRFRQHRRGIARAAAAFVVLAIAGGVAWWLWPTEKANAKPAIAVLPFESYGAEGQVSRLADGITEDIITDLARFRILDVIARNSTEVYKERQVDIRQIGRELDVDYVLEGSIQQQGDDIRTTAQLIDARSGKHVWSDRWDRPAEDIFAVQSEISETIAGVLGSNLITRTEFERASRLRPNDLQAYQYFLMGHEIKRHPTRETIPKGIEYMNKAIALDPSFARAYNHRAWLNYIWLSYSGDDADTLLASFIADAEKAAQLDPQYGEGLSTLAFARLIHGRFAEAV
jgi:TolB-like protein/class 3 adenylate cyclase